MENNENISFTNLKDNMININENQESDINVSNKINNISHFWSKENDNQEEQMENEKNDEEKKESNDENEESNDENEESNDENEESNDENEESNFLNSDGNKENNYLKDGVNEEIVDTPNVSKIDNEYTEDSYIDVSGFEELYINDIKNISRNLYVRCIIKENDQKEITLFNSCQNIPLIKLCPLHLLFSDRNNFSKKIILKELVNIILKKELFIENNSNNYNIINDAYICQKHNKKKFFQFCKECQVNICEDCLNEEHKNHLRIIMDNIFIDNIKGILEQLQKIVISIIRYKKRELKNKKNKFDEKIKIKILYCSIINGFIKEAKIMIENMNFNYNIFQNLKDHLNA